MDFFGFLWKSSLETGIFHWLYFRQLLISPLFICFVSVAILLTHTIPVLPLDNTKPERIFQKLCFTVSLLFGCVNVSFHRGKTEIFHDSTDFPRLIGSFPPIRPGSSRFFFSRAIIDSYVFARPLNLMNFLRPPPFISASFASNIE